MLLYYTRHVTAIIWKKKKTTTATSTTETFIFFFLHYFSINYSLLCLILMARTIKNCSYLIKRGIPPILVLNYYKTIFTKTTSGWNDLDNDNDDDNDDDDNNTTYTNRKRAKTSASFRRNFPIASIFLYDDNEGLYVKQTNRNPRVTKKVNKRSRWIVNDLLFFIFSFEYNKRTTLNCFHPSFANYSNLTVTEIRLFIL